MIIVDVETGGLDPRKNPLLAIGAIDFDSGSQFYIECRPRPDLVIEDQALEVNGFTREYLEKIDIPTYDALISFLSWCHSLTTDYTIAGENPSFDRDFISENLKYFGLENPFGHRTVDLHTLSYISHIVRNVSLPIENRKNRLTMDKTLVYLGFSAEPRPHKAYNGALYEYYAFKRLLGE